MITSWTKGSQESHAGCYPDNSGTQGKYIFVLFFDGEQARRHFMDISDAHQTPLVNNNWA